MTASTQTASPRKESGFDEALFGRLFAAEDRHFWFRARSAIVGTLLRELESHLAPGYRVVEIGCGTGYMLRSLAAIFSRGAVFGLDVHWEGLQYARRRTSVPLVAGDVGAVPLRHGFEVAAMFDVLEHVHEDARILTDVRRLLTATGRLVLTVPAHPSLWSYTDEVARHCRRYTPASLRAVLGHAGFAVEYLTQFMSLLYPVLWAARRSVRGTFTAEQKIRRSGEELRIRAGLNELLTWVLSQEGRVVARRNRLPIGTSLLAVAHRRGRSW